MPASRKPKPKESEDTKKRLAIALAEAKNRGLNIDLESFDEVKSKIWPVDSSGYFVKNDGTLFNANEHQKNFVFSQASFSGLISGRGGGKTSSGAQKSLRKIRQGQSGVVINPDFENFKISTWPEFREWIPWDMVVPSHRYRGNAEWSPHQPFTLAFMNGAVAYCKGLKDPDSARGPNVNWLWYDEAGRDLEGLGWKLAVAGVRVGKSPQAWITTTPRGRDHWIYNFFVKQDIPEEALEAFEEAMKSVGMDTPLVEIFETTIEENKENLDPLFYARMLSSYTGYLKLQELDGKFVDAGGVLGDRSWFIGKIKGITPISSENLKGRIRFWDLAASEKKLVRGKKRADPDHTVGTRLSAGGGIFCIEDQIAGQIAWHEILQLIIDTAYLDGNNVTIVVEQEPASGGKNQVAQIMGLPELAGYKVLGRKPEGDKVMRAQSWFAKAAEGLVYLVRGEWNEPFLDQLSSFPLGLHDDRIDSVSGAFQYIAPARAYKNIGFKHL